MSDSISTLKYSVYRNHPFNTPGLVNPIPVKEKMSFFCEASRFAATLVDKNRSGKPKPIYVVATTWEGKQRIARVVTLGLDTQFFNEFRKENPLAKL